MAELMMSKACMFSPSYSIHHHHRSSNPLGVSLLPIKSAFFASGLRASSSLKLRPFYLRSSSSASNSQFYDRRFLFLQGLEGIPNNGSSRSSTSLDVHAQMRTGLIGKTQKWWEKGLQPNMKEVQGALHLVDSLLNAGDRLVVVDYFSPGCGGCKALHPKICQLAEMNPDVEFLQVNYEEHKSMCGSLNVHVLPFFRFYRGAHGRLCSFSCTNATIKKFKDALAKHSPDRCSLGPPKGLEEKELLALAANRDLSFNYTPKPEVPMPIPAQGVIFEEMTPVPASHSETYPRLSLPMPSTSTNAAQGTGDKHLVASGR